jgi:hypothetical protein
MTPEQKRAMLAQLLKQKTSVTKTAFMLQTLFLDILIAGAPVWNMSSTVRLFNKVDPELMRARMQKVIDRHPSLRTTYEIPRPRQLGLQSKVFLLRMGTLRLHDLYLDTYVEQRIHPEHTLDFSCVDATDWSAERLRQRLVDDAQQPYDITQLPVCRLRIYQCANYDVMQLDIHHCVADLWSLELIMAELEEPSDTPLQASFAEFCTWQHAWFALPKAAEMRRWWQKYLRGCPPMVVGPSHGKDPADVVLFRLDAEIVAQARLACRVHKVTLFNLLLSTMQATLGRALGLNDFSIGGVMANRPNHRFEDTVGFFSHFVMYRCNLTEIPSWEDLWTQNRATLTEIMDRHFYPVVCLPLPRTDFYISFHQYKKARWIEHDVPQGDSLGVRSGGVVDSPLGPWEFLFIEAPYTSAPVMFELLEQKDGIQGVLRFRIPCFSRERGEFYARDFQDRFRASLADPSAPIS